MLSEWMLVIAIAVLTLWVLMAACVFLCVWGNKAVHGAMYAAAIEYVDSSHVLKRPSGLMYERMLVFRVLAADHRNAGPANLNNAHEALSIIDADSVLWHHLADAVGAWARLGYLQGSGVTRMELLRQIARAPVTLDIGVHEQPLNSKDTASNV